MLAVDGGRTGCRIGFYDGTSWLAVCHAPGVAYSSHSAPHTLRASWESALDELPPEARRPDRVVAGVAGILGHPARAVAVTELLADLVEARRITVTGDVVIAYCGALDLQAGALIVAGTGAVALAVGPDGEHALADGAGYILGDSGSGFSIGRRGLESAWRAHDGRYGSEHLRVLAQEAFGDLELLPSVVYGSENPVGLVAGFAPKVAQAAEAGDVISQGIWEWAASELAVTVAAAARRVVEVDRPFPVSWHGGVFGAGDLILRPFLQAVGELLPSAEPVPPLGDPLRGALVLDGLGTGLIDPLLHAMEV